MGLDDRLGVTHLYLARVERQGGNHESGLSHLRIAQESLAQCDNAKIAHEVQLAARDLEEAIVRGCARDGGGEFSNVLKVSQILGGKEPEDKRLLKALELLTRWVQADAGMILVVDPRSGKKEAEVSLDLSRPVLDQVRRFLQKQIQGARGPLLFLAGSEDMILLDSAGKTPGSALVVPLRAGEHLLGGLYLERGSEREYLGPRQVTLALASADVVSLALHGFYFERRLREHLSAQVLYQEIITQNQQMQEIIRIIEKVKDSSATVLILGESGTGKELAARAIHRNSRRAEQPFVAINCAALPPSLAESELFGHEKGAFTGALAQKKGKLEVAAGGTVFLDEIGELDLGSQSKLLRVLQERELERVGATRPIPVDFRLIAATNQNLEQALGAGRFRQDLYYRLNVVSVRMPALRERREDIPLLAACFMARYSVKCGRRSLALSNQARECLVTHDWPGNVRELENAIERAVVLGSSELVLPEDLPESILERAPPDQALCSRYHGAVAEAKRQVILQALEQAGGSYKDAAGLLGIHPNNLHRLVNKLGLRPALKKATP
jgi:Nif-specific regulatory protein